MRKSFYISFALVFFGILFPVAAQKERIYISPNNDGVQDELTVPLSVSDKRYIKEWSFVITDQSGNVVRKIGNKIKFPEKLTFKTFFTRLFEEKKGVDIPSYVVWDGTFDSGEIAPDGLYFYYFTASDDNDNISSTNPLEVFVDNTPPAIQIAQPASDVDKIFGEGAKSTFEINQEGSAEDLWQAAFYNVAGNPVRTFQWKDVSPASFHWDGCNDSGVPVPDGVYSYRISAIDRAGNKSPLAQVSNIIYSAEKPGTNIAIKGSRYFSPNKDGIQDTVSFDVTIPSGSKTSGNRLVKWQIAINDASGNIVKTFAGTDDAPAILTYDGTDSSGKILPDGSYQAVVTASYLNGFVPEPIRSPLFILDTTLPVVSVRATDSIFSPDGDSRMDTLQIVQDTSREKEWRGQIQSQDGKPVRDYLFGELPDSSFAWNGLNNDGGLCDDGFYTYRLYTTDLAGNSAEAITAAFELNTGTTEVILTTQPVAFSPNNDKVQDTVTLTPVVKTQSGIASYELNIMDSHGEVVKTFKEDRALPTRFTWNGLTDEGLRCADGIYTASLETVAKNGSVAKTTAPAFELDTVLPLVELSVPYTLFSPDGDSNKDVVPIEISSSKEQRWIGRIETQSGALVREYIWEGNAQSFDWDGTDESGNLVEDGEYNIIVSSQDAAGNTGSAKIQNLTLDVRETKIYLTASEEAFSPNGDGFKDSQVFSIRTTLNEGIETWSFEIKATDGTTVRSWNQSDSPDVPATITWDGVTATGALAEGSYTALLNITYTKGNKVSAATAPFICSATPPQLMVKTAPVYFSPDNDGIDDDLFISLSAKSAVALKNWSFTVYDPQNGKVFWSRTGGSAVTERMVWDGRGNNGELVQSATDYPYTFAVTDELGMSSQVSGLISVDVLVIRVGDVLKIQVPSIIFRSDNADFKGRDEEPKNGLEQSVIDNNVRVIKRIAEILNKFKDYTVRIEGHANNITGTEEEETSTANGNIPLVPLSEARAETVKQMLIDFGVSEARLSTVGMGGRQPVVPREDRDNWWKNRRVEFILNK
ncbi:MAG: OmpA family protein [Spirochaetaceae bacterium]|nr:OmpA family protein [Spirochaetaceae bacterium]